jgi:hypothetical protein
MMISRKLANKVQNRLQLIMSLVETNQEKKALKEIRELSSLVSSHVESLKEEVFRIQRENSED